MGLIQLLGGSPDVGNWFDQHRNAITQAGYGLASQRGFGGAAGGLAAGAPLDTAAVAAKDAEQARQQQINGTLEYLKTRYPDLANAVANGYPISDAWNEALKRQNPVAGKVSLTDQINERINAGKAQGLTGPDLTSYGLTGNLPGGNASVRGSLGEPMPFKDPKTGAYHPIQKFNDGMIIDLTTQQPPDKSLVYDPFGFKAQQTGAVVDSKTAAAARAALPGAEQNYKVTMDTLANFDPNNTADTAKAVRAGEEEQFSKVMGVPTGQILPDIQGTYKAQFRTIINQLSGQAFLNIRQALKGAGQVTDFEGQKGEIALSRMKDAADRGDKASFQQALLDYTQAIDNGMVLLRQTAASDFAADNPQDGPSAAPGPSASPHVLTYNPATGELE